MAAAAGEEDITAAIAVTDMVIMDTEPTVGITGTEVTVATMVTAVTTAAGTHRFILESGSVIQPMDIMAIRLMGMLMPLLHIPRTLTIQRNHMGQHQPLLAQASRRP